MLHSAMLKCKTDASIKSDEIEAPTIQEAKQAVKKNYQQKFDNNLMALT